MQGNVRLAIDILAQKKKEKKKAGAILTTVVYDNAYTLFSRR